MHITKYSSLWAALIWNGINKDKKSSPVRMAERSKALRSGRSPVFRAWVQIPLLTRFFYPELIQLRSATVRIVCQYFRAVVAEWLRRLTRNQIPSGSVGSNPTNCGWYFVLTIAINTVDLIEFFEAD